MAHLRLSDTIYTPELIADSITIPAGAINADSQISAGAAITRAKMAQENLAVFPISLLTFVTWNSVITPLPADGANDDLGLATGTIGTDVPKLTSNDLKGQGATTRYAATIFSMPTEYQASETIQIRLSAGMETTVADTTATADVEVYTFDRDGTSSADLCATAAQSCNALAFDDLDFTITDATFDRDTTFFLRVALAINDAATGTEVRGTIGAVELLCDIKG